MTDPNIVVHRRLARACVEKKEIGPRVTIEIHPCDYTPALFLAHFAKKVTGGSLPSLPAKTAGQSTERLLQLLDLSA